MKAHIYRREDYDLEVKVLDINLISKEECELTKLPRFCCDRGCFCVNAVMTFSNLDLPIGSDVWFMGSEDPYDFSHWYIFAKNKGVFGCLFKSDKYTEDETKLQTMLLEWAEKAGIKFG